MGRWFTMLLASAALLGCTSSPNDVVSLTSPSTLRIPNRALPEVQVRVETDKRPIEEHGRRKYPGISYLGGNDVAEPTSVSLVRILARDLVQTGVARAAGLGERAGGYILGITIKHLGASYNDGIETLVPLLPTSAIDARCVVRVIMRDHVGRVYLDQEFGARRRSMAAALTGIQATAAATLGAAIRDTVDQIIPAVSEAVPAFWKRLGRDPPGDSGRR